MNTYQGALRDAITHANGAEASGSGTDGAREIIPELFYAKITAQAQVAQAYALIAIAAALGGTDAEL